MKTEQWTLFTKRTNDPKLSYLEHRLDQLKIPHRRNGESFHAPILEVAAEHLERANAILEERIGRYRLDDIRDDARRFLPFARYNELISRLEAQHALGEIQ